PRDLFEKRLPARFREVGPRVVQGPDSMVWQAEGKILGYSGKRPSHAAQYATVRAGREDDGFRPSTPALRLADMDLDGIWTQVIYGPPMGFPLEDQELKAAVLRAYNDWAAEFNAHAPGRLCVLAMLPVHDAMAATAELRRVLDAGAAVVNGLTFIERIAGIPTQTPWGVGARIFLRADLARTTGGVLLGLLVSLAMSIAGAFLVSLALRVFGLDYAPLKGILVLNALGFVTLGFFAPLLGIAPLLRGDLTTNFVAVVNLSVVGAVQGGLVQRLLGGTVRAGKG
ncbi:MAG: hypothetical protein K6U03_07615, partial [Firmicutes bacterium]|nr:hypothetical protein [Bacillota bacterium]